MGTDRKTARIGSQRALVWAIAAAIVLGAVLAAILIRADNSGFASGVLAETWDRLDGETWLRPKLHRARVFIPARPLSRNEDAGPSKERLELITRVQSFEVSTSAQRLRNRRVKKKRADATRVLVIGDSVSFGWGVEDHETWPLQLEQQLRDKGREVEIINASMPGVFSATMLLYCQNVAPDFEPDLVLWVRRPEGLDQPPYDEYIGRVLSCREALGVPALLVLTPMGTFDWGYPQVSEEAMILQEACDRAGLPLLALNPLFEEAARGRGYALSREGDVYLLVNQATGELRQAFSADAPVGDALHQAPPQYHSVIPAPLPDAHFHPPPELPAAFYALLDRDHSIVEPLFVDGSHLSVEGGAVMASGVAEALEPMLAELRPAR